jgi:hypothetical protein
MNTENNSGVHMKKLIILASFLVTANSFASCIGEAQFIGKITSIRVEAIDQGVRDCFYKMQFSLYNQSMVCPLDEMDAMNAEIFDYDCRTNIGDTVSGVLVKNLDGSFTIE